MIVEVFYRGTNFKKVYNTFWNVKNIVHDGYFIILVFRNSKYDVVSLREEDFELRVSC